LSQEFVERGTHFRGVARHAYAERQRVLGVVAGEFRHVVLQAPADRVGRLSVLLDHQGGEPRRRQKRPIISELRKGVSENFRGPSGEAWSPSLWPN